MSAPPEAGAEGLDRVGPEVGADVGTSLVKLARRDGPGRIDLRLLPRQGLDRVAAEIEAVRPQRLGLTGAGAAELAVRLRTQSRVVDEFASWRVGAGHLLREAGSSLERYLLVSLGTGTSALRVEGADCTRVGGTALGGGTVVGLGAGLIDCADFEELCRLARRGDRRRVDLLVSEIGDVPLPGDVTASAFAKLARPGSPAPEPADIAHAIMGLVGENVALVCNALAAAHRVRHLVFAGSTLRGNPALGDILRGLTTVLGHEPLLPARGEFAGALGALEMAAGAG